MTILDQLNEVAEEFEGRALDRGYDGDFDDGKASAYEDAAARVRELINEVNKARQ